MGSTPCPFNTPTTEERLCSQCSKLNLQRYVAPISLRLYWDLPKHITFDRPLLVSTTASCALCRLLAQSIKPTPDGAPLSINGVRFENLGDTQTLEGTPTESLCMIIDGPKALRLAPYGNDTFRLGARRCSYARLVQPDCANMELIKSWLQKCEKEHQECLIAPLKSNSQVAVPQYIIDVEEMQLREVGTEKLRYLALSYVWGETKPLGLRKANLNQLTKPNSLRECFGELSNVVRDAMTFTQKLGERYLWIDTLCICQDNYASKKVQIDTMNIVYAKAAMTLVALEGHDASYGLPGVQPYPQPRHQPIERIHQLRMATVMPNISELEKRSAWRSRAWTYQEELFSRRLLFFTNHQVYFRCQHSTYCEDRFEDYSDLLTARGKGLFGVTHPSYEMWQRLVINYSTRVFRDDIDRYNAFAGIENQLRHHWKLPCLMGIPVKYLVRGLYWHLRLTKTHQGRTNVCRISTYPSWSWSGWKGGVMLPPLNVRFDISDVEISGTVYKFNDRGKMLLTTADSGNSQLEEIIDGLQKQPKFLSFSAYSSRFRLNTSRFASEGVLLVETQRRKICGIIYGAHLPLQSISQDESVLYECILIGSCCRPGAFDRCNYSQPGDAQFLSWAAPSKEMDSLTPQNLSEVHERAAASFRALQLIPTPGYGGEIELDWLEGLRCKVELIDWLCKLVGGFIKAFFYILFMAGLFVYAVLLVGIGLGLLGLLISAFGLVLGLLVAFCIIVPLVILLVGIICWISQQIFNSFPGITRKWYAWDSMSRTRPGRWVDENFVDRLPLKCQRFLHKFWSKPMDDIEMELSKWQRQRYEWNNNHNVVLIMLVESHPVSGADVCERLAVGEMSAHCWWDSQPIHRRVVLQ